MKDNHRLYVESAKWLGVPYRGGGNNKRGIDCSGLTSHLYKKSIARSWNATLTTSVPKLP